MKRRIVTDKSLYLRGRWFGLVNGIRRAGASVRPALVRGWHWRQGLTRLAKCRGLGWLDRWVFRRLGFAPRCLSSTVDWRRLRVEWSSVEPSWTRRCERFAWRHHSVSKAVFLALAFFAFLILFCVVFGRAVFSDACPAQDVQSQVSTLGTLAQVTGGILGALLAVVTFSVGLRAQREDDAVSLIPFVAQRYHMFFISAFVVAVAAADGVMPVLQPWVSFGAIRLLLVLNVGFVPACLGLSLWLVCKVIQDASTATLANTLPVIEAQMWTAAQRDARGVLLVEAYTASVTAAGLEYNGIGWYKPAGGAVQDEFLINRRGRVVDVDLRVLKGVSEQVQGIGGGIRALITVQPGDVISSKGMLVLRQEPPPSEPTSLSVSKTAPPASNVEEHRRREITALLRRLFVIRRGA